MTAITFNGDTGVDTLTNSGNNVGTISYTGGSDADTLINSGDNIGSIHFIGSGSDATLTDSGSAGVVYFSGGSSNAAFIYSAPGTAGSAVTFNGYGGGNVFVDQGYAGSVTVNLGTGDNTAVVMTGASGNVDLIGGGGNNTYMFSGTTTANVTIDQPLMASVGTMQGNTFVADAQTTGGTNTLDFSGYTGGGVGVDLMNTSKQPIAGGLSLTLADAEGFTNVVGSQYSNTISGNLRADSISTAALPDARVAGQLTAASATFTPDARTQWVFLDFDTYTDMTLASDPNSTVHIYTSDERAEILQRIQLDYYGPDPNNSSLPDFTNRWFDVQVTDDLSQIPANLVAAGQYATLYFNRTPPSGLPGGESSEVDLGNRDLGGYASIQINGMVGGADQPDATTARISSCSAPRSAPTRWRT